MVFVAGQSAIVHPCYTFVLLQKFGHTLGILAMTRYAQMQRLESEVEQERVLGCRNGAEVAHQLCYELGHICHLAERFGVGQSVI